MHFSVYNPKNRGLKLNVYKLISFLSSQLSIAYNKDILNAKCSFLDMNLNLNKKDIFCAILPNRKFLLLHSMFFISAFFSFHEDRLSALGI